MVAAQISKASLQHSPNTLDQQADTDLVYNDALLG